MSIGISGNDACLVFPTAENWPRMHHTLLEFEEVLRLLARRAGLQDVAGPGLLGHRSSDRNVSRYAANGGRREKAAEELAGVGKFAAQRPAGRFSEVCEIRHLSAR